jgi:protein-L-isoaspartate(D-aspartate) O-methyltransferase
MLVTRRGKGFEVKPLMPSWFIPCIGASRSGAHAKLPDREAAQSTRSIRLIADREPDATATAIIGNVWFSSEPADG